MTVAGLLLAGGASRRFGSEKALASRDAGLLVDAPLRALTGACANVAVSARSGSGMAQMARARGLAVLSDPADAPQGPLAGVLAGLRWALGQGATWLATAPCDTPLLRVDQMTALIIQAKPGCGAVARSENGIEPLIAVWPVEESLIVLEPILAAGRHPAVNELLASLGAAPVGGFDAANINTRADLEQLATRTSSAELR